MNKGAVIKTFTIITPCFNAEAYIEETVRSVVLNRAIREKRAALDYIICDGGSTDSTLAKIDSILKTIDVNGRVKVFSEPDGGIYDALSKGLIKGSGDVYAYLNAGDYYSPYVFDIVLDLFKDESVKWLTGMNVKYNEQSHLVHVLVPFRYRRRLINTGFYGNMLPHIQQESTFWRADLNRLIDPDKLKKYQLAGDYYLWKSFSSQAELNIVEAWLGGFRHHRGQISANKVQYRKELKHIAELPGFEDYIIAALDYFCWHCLPPLLKKKLNPKMFYRFDHARQMYV